MTKGMRSLLAPRAMRAFSYMTVLFLSEIVSSEESDGDQSDVSSSVFAEVMGQTTSSTAATEEVPTGVIPDDSSFETHPMEQCIVYTAILLLPLYCVAATEAVSYFFRRLSQDSNSPR